MLQKKTDPLISLTVKRSFHGAIEQGGHGLIDKEKERKTAEPS